MNVNEISDEVPAIPAISPIEPHASAGSSSVDGTEQSLLSALQASSSGISPMATFLSHLEMLQEEYPAQLVSAETRVGAQLHEDAKTAAVEGNQAQADNLERVAAVFDSSAQSGQLMTVEDLHNAGISREHDHANNDSTPPAVTTSPATDSIESIVATDVLNVLNSLNS